LLPGLLLDAAGVTKATPYTLRHSFASLLLHERRSVIDVARQRGHDARLTLTRYGHHRRARRRAERFRGKVDPPSSCSLSVPQHRETRNAATTQERKKPRDNGASWAMELAGLEPATSWVRSRRSPS
jgi:hypothetical protein